MVWALNTNAQLLVELEYTNMTNEHPLNDCHWFIAKAKQKLYKTVDLLFTIIMSELITPILYQILTTIY